MAEFLPVARICLLFALALTGIPRVANTAPDLLTSSQRAWLAAHPDLVIGMPSDYPPGVILGSNGQITGIGSDFLELINQRLGTGIRIEPGHWGEVVERAERRDIDIIGFTFPLEAYRAGFNFTAPSFKPITTFMPAAAMLIHPEISAHCPANGLAISLIPASSNNNSANVPIWNWFRCPARMRSWRRCSRNALT